MLEPACCSEVRTRLVRHGLAAARIERVVRELSEHWEDSYADALAQGQSEEDAAAIANLRLGEPSRLAESIIAGLRRSSWFGRHPVLTICVFPMLLAPLLMAVSAMPLWGLYEWMDIPKKEGAQAVRDAVVIVSGVWLIYAAALAAVPVWLSRQIWRAGLGLRWVVAACSLCALFALARYFNADVIERNVTFGFRFPWRLDLQNASIVLLHAALVLAYFRRARQGCSQSLSRCQNY